MWKKTKRIFQRMSPFKMIATYYLLTVIIATILLSLPFARQPGVPYSFMDTLFLAFSAVSVTGLTTVNIGETFSLAGIAIILFILQIGGIGIMALATFLWILTKKRIGLRQRQLIMTDHNQLSLAGLVRMLKQIVIIFLLIEVIGALVLGFYFLAYYPTWQEAFLNGLFISVSATTNAGFDLTGNSLQVFHRNYFVQIIIMILIFLGAIGFPVLIEVKDFIKKRIRKQKPRFSLFAKITTSTYIILFLVGALIFIAIESRNYLIGTSWHESMFYGLFQSISTRSAGLTTLELSQLSMPTLLIFALLMFIGASPSSAGGGIRTTTFALNILFLYNFSRGRRSVQLFNREIHEEDLLKSFVVTLFAIIICFLAVLILAITEDQPLLVLLFEVCSAFGTSGMSLGVTEEFSTIGKIVLMLLMFIGRVGILSFIFIIGGNDKKRTFHYPKERIIIG